MFLKHKSMNLFRYVSLAILVASVSACSGGDASSDSSSDSGDKAADLSGKITIDGSSTVLLISEAMAEEFQAENSGVQITVGKSGTGGGFKKFCAGQTEISDASRPIKTEEQDLCAQNNVEFVELPVAYDALSVVVNQENDWAECMKVDELKTIWEKGAQGKISKWNQVNPEYPDAPLTLYGPGTDSGTFDYFNEAITDEESRGDFATSEDDNTIVRGVSGDKNAMGYFGYAYYEENKDKLKAVEIDDGNGCVAPSDETVLDGTYSPLARPLFIYVSKSALEKPHVKAFTEYYMDPANKELVDEVGYFPMPEDIYTKAQARLEEAKTGTMFPDGKTVGVKLADVL